jgi:hypothetical protein
MGFVPDMACGSCEQTRQSLILGEEIGEIGAEMCRFVGISGDPMRKKQRKIRAKSGATRGNTQNVAFLLGKAELARYTLTRTRRLHALSQARVIRASH